MTTTKSKPQALSPSKRELQCWRVGLVDQFLQAARILDKLPLSETRGACSALAWATWRMGMQPTGQLSCGQVFNYFLKPTRQGDSTSAWWLATGTLEDGSDIWPESFLHKGQSLGTPKTPGGQNRARCQRLIALSLVAAVVEAMSVRELAALKKTLLRGY